MCRWRPGVQESTHQLAVQVELWCTHSLYTTRRLNRCSEPLCLVRRFHSCVHLTLVIPDGVWVGSVHSRVRCRGVRACGGNHCRIQRAGRAATAARRLGRCRALRRATAAVTSTAAATDVAAAAPLLRRCVVQQQRSSFVGALHSCICCICCRCCSVVPDVRGFNVATLADITRTLAAVPWWPLNACQSIIRIARTSA